MSYGYLTTIAALAQEKNKIASSLEAYIAGIGYQHQEDLSAQKTAWFKEIDFLIQAFAHAEINGAIPVVFEYMLPNENTERPDVMLLCAEKVVILEFKTSGHIADMDYATQYLGYRDFFLNYHQYNVKHKMAVESYLVFNAARSHEICVAADVKQKFSAEDLSFIVGNDTFSKVLSSLRSLTPMKDVQAWLTSQRCRSPKIWESAIILRDALKNGDKESLSRISGIKYKYLRRTDECITDIIENQAGKRIVFVSGVPGAGKTLIGILTLFRNLAARRGTRYYTGNGALINVLKNKLATRDIAFFTGFRNDFVINQRVCNDQVMIFDEAQRFWTAEQAKTACTDAAGIINANYATDVTVVCLIGNGQRPMQGEAGIEAWIEALEGNPSWSVYASSENKEQFTAALGSRVCIMDDLFLDTSMRAEFTDNAPFVEAVLSGNKDLAREEYKKIKASTRIRMTRSFEALYQDSGNGSILQKQKKKSEQEGKEYLYGVLCSAKSNDRDVNKWLGNRLKDGQKYQKNDRAGVWYSGECCCENPISVATETFCQGLEIDLPILLFGGDYYLTQENGTYSWTVANNYQTRKLPKPERETIMQDTYRILMTRTTKNMFLYIPQDELFSDTYKFFKEVGIEEWPSKK